MIIDCIGCLHGARPKLQGGDLLIVTGDLTSSDKPHQYLDLFQWLFNQKYTKKVLIAGNHDNEMENRYVNFDFNSQCSYLYDSGTEFEGLKIWGSPWTKTFKGINPKCKAFTKDSEDELMDMWEMIPHDTDILITHTPPYGILDGIPIEDGSKYHAGSMSLFNWLKYVERPRLHVFSHIHEAYGQTEYFPSYNNKMMISVNCSIMNAHYMPVNEPIRVILGDKDLPRCG